MSGRVVMDAYGSATGVAGVARGNLTLSRRAAGRVPTDPVPTASCIDGLDVPSTAPGPAVVASACTPPPVRERVEVAEP